MKKRLKVRISLITLGWVYQLEAPGTTTLRHMRKGCQGWGNGQIQRYVNTANQSMQAIRNIVNILYQIDLDLISVRFLLLLFLRQFGDGDSVSVAKRCHAIDIVTAYWYCTVYLSLIFLSGFPFHVMFLFGGLGPILTSERGKAWDMDAGTIILQIFFLLNSCISTLPLTRPSIFLAYFYIFASLNALLHDFTRGTIPIHSLTSQDPPSPTVTPEPTCILFPLPLTIQTTDLFPPLHPSF